MYFMLINLQDVDLLIEITKMVGQWITNTSASNSNTFAFAGKEKILFLTKMTRFDQIPSTELQGLFLDLVYHVFSDPAANREQSQLEAGFMMGLRSKDPTVRNNFFELFHKSIGSVCRRRREEGGKSGRILLRWGSITRTVGGMHKENVWT